MSAEGPVFQKPYDVRDINFAWSFTGAGEAKEVKDKLHHVALIKFHEGVSREIQEEIFSRYQTLAEDCGGVAAGILFFEVAWNRDLRKGVQLVERATFADDDALQRFRAHPKHAELAEMLKHCADWWVGDTLAPV